MPFRRKLNPAGRSPSPPGERMPAASRQRGVGWRGSPLRTNKGADSGFRRTQCLHPRRAQRKVQVCGEITVQSDGQGETKYGARVGTSSTAVAVPLLLVGEGLSAVESGVRLTMSGVAL